MTTPSRPSGAGRPWHLWFLAIVTFALFVGGGRDYVLILLQDTDYIVGQFGSAGLDYFTDYPLALRVIWTLTVVGGLVAPVLLLARSRWSIPVAVVATVSQVVLLAVTFTFLGRWEALGAATAWFDIGIGVYLVFFTWYCWMAQRRDRLR